MDQTPLPRSSAISVSPSSNSKLTEESIYERGIMPRFGCPSDSHYPIEFQGNSYPCGDFVRIGMTIENKVILDIRHDSRACCLTTALTDILCEHLKGRTIEALMLISPTDVIDLKTPVAKNREGCIRLPFGLLKELYGKAPTL